MTPLLGRIAPVRTGRWNLALDLLLICIAMGLSMHFTGGGPFSALLWTRVGVGCCVWLVTAAALHQYDPWVDERTPTDDAMMTTVLCLSVGTTLFILNKFASGYVPVPRTVATLSFLLPAAIGMRRLVFAPIARKDGPLDDVIIVGVGSLGRVTGEDLERSARRRVIGFLNFPYEAAPTKLAYKYLGASSELEGFLASMPVTEVYIAGNALKNGEAMQDIIRVCERQGVPFALPATMFRFERAQPVSDDNVADGYAHYLPFHVKPQQMALKRLFDIAATAAALWMLLPVMAFIALAIKLTSRGPVLFRQVRVGLNGKQFNMLKFRSMVLDAEAQKAKLADKNEQAGPVFKMKNDPRVTGIGRFIRKYSLDELPQLINVLRGDMSIVGPRPPVPSEVAKYETWQRRRLSMRPGLTCIWQVSGRNQISFDQWMYLDMQYIDHWSFALDLNLIAKTVPVVLTGSGAS